MGKLRIWSASIDVREAHRQITGVEWILARPRAPLENGLKTEPPAFSGNARTIRLAKIAPQPWRNGLGQTRELLAWPRLDDWQLRVSVATVEADGPFSAYPGVERWFAVMEGQGVALTIDGAVHRMTAHSLPLRFDGGAAVAGCLLGGATRDLNLMVRGGGGVMRSVTDGLAWTARGSPCGLFAMVPGRCMHDGGTALDVPAESLTWFDGVSGVLTFEPRTADRASPLGWWLGLREPARKA